MRKMISERHLILVPPECGSDQRNVAQEGDLLAARLGRFAEQTAQYDRLAVLHHHVCHQFVGDLIGNCDGGAGDVGRVADNRFQRPAA